MKGIELTAFDLAQRFVGLKEVDGKVANPQILAMLQLDGDWPKDDAVPWCSAFVNYVCWLLRLPRSKSLLARSWLAVGRAVELVDAVPGFDVVVLSRADSPLCGHVGFFAGGGRPPDGSNIRPVSPLALLGGNQANQVCVEPFDVTRVVGVRRLIEVSE
jgi:uncharacterized protein (TIGR02594 family)